MAEDWISLLQQAVRGVLAALKMPDVDDEELHDLAIHIGYTGELGSLLNPLPQAERFIAQTHQVEIRRG